MSASTDKESLHHIPVIGIFFGALAAIGYTSANGFLRELSKTADPAWVSLSKATCTVILFAPCLLWLYFHKPNIFPKPKTIGLLIFAGLFVQLAGNLLFQSALSEIGVALIVPLTLGSMVLSGAIVGRIVLKEPVNLALAAALAFLVIAIVVLSTGASEVHASDNRYNYLEWIPAVYRPTIACISAMIAGLSFTVLGVSIRISMKENIPSATPMVIVGICGIISLGAISAGQYGTSLIFETTARQWVCMVLAGLSNSLAFLSLTKALKKLPVVYVNAINVSQVALAAVMGVTIFSEPITTELVIGVLIMVAGFTTIGIASNRRKQRENLRRTIHVSEQSDLNDANTVSVQSSKQNDHRPKNRLVELNVTNVSNSNSKFAISDSIQSEKSS